MYSEIALLTLIGYAGYRFKNRTYYKFQNKLKDMYKRERGFTNKLGKAPRLIYVNELNYGFELGLDLSGAMSYEEFENKENYMKTFFKAKDIKISLKNNDLTSLTLIKDKYSFVPFKPVKTKNNEVFLGYDRDNKPVIVNMDKFPHILIGGDTGTGKSRVLMALLTNLITNNDVNLYLMQIRKGDLTIFRNCKQTKEVAQTLDDTLEVLRNLNNICVERDKKIEDYIEEGIYNISDWNKRFKYRQMKYIYAVIEEFSFYNPSGADTKEEKLIKKEILGLIKNIVAAGRSSGVFIITSLQKPTNSSIPTDIKAQLCTRVSMHIADKETSIIILGNANATKLGERECIVRTLGEKKCFSTTIDHDIIMENIKDSLVKKEAKKKPKKENKYANNKGIIDFEVIRSEIEG